MAACEAPAVQLAEAVIGAVRIGIPAAAVLQAIPAPPPEAVLPRRRGALCGVVEYDGGLVPVVDLARWVEVGEAAPGAAAPGTAAPGAAAHARVLVLRDGLRSIGLRVDAVGGLVDLAPGQLTRLHHDDDEEEVFHSVARALDGGSVLSVLDVGRLADLAQAWHRADGAPGRSAGAAAAVAADTGSAADAPRHPYAVLQAGAMRLGVPAADLAEIIPMPALERFGTGAGGAAYCLWRGRHLAVLAADALAPDATTDAAADAQGEAPLLAVIVHAGLALGLPVHAALELRAFGAATVPCAGGIGATLFDEEGRAVRLLDTARLFACFPEATLSRDGALQGTRHAPRGAAQAANAVAYIVFEADGHGALPIDTVEEVLALPPAVAAAPRLPAAMAWRGGSIALADLRPDAGVRPGAPGHVLVVRGAHGPAAYVATRLHVMVPAGAGRLYRMGVGSRAVEFIATGEGTQQASYRIVDPAAAAVAAVAAAATAARAA